MYQQTTALGQMIQSFQKIFSGQTQGVDSLPYLYRLKWTTAAPRKRSGSFALHHGAGKAGNMKLDEKQRPGLAGAALGNSGRFAAVMILLAVLLLVALILNVNIGSVSIPTGEILKKVARRSRVLALGISLQAAAFLSSCKR